MSPAVEASTRSCHSGLTQSKLNGSWSGMKPSTTSPACQAGPMVSSQIAVTITPTSEKALRRVNRPTSSRAPAIASVSGAAQPSASTTCFSAAQAGAIGLIGSLVCGSSPGSAALTRRTTTPG